MEIVYKVAKGLLDGVADGNLVSYDPVDLYETTLGKLSKKLWNRGSKLGLVLAIPIQVAEVFLPQVRYVVSKKRKQPICYAQAGLSYLLLAQTSLGGQQFVKLANICLDQLISMAVKTKSGIGWGINVDWLTKGGYIPASTPCHTQTAYCFEFISLFYKLFPNPELLNYLHQISEHVSYDYQEFVDEETGIVISGYSILDKRPVVNAVSYRGSTLFLSYRLFSDKKYLDKASNSLEFVLLSQKDTGEWYYSSKEEFVDGYHTCFILKNLCSIRDVLMSMNADNTLIARVENAISKGVSFYKSNLINKYGFPIPFSRTNKPVLYEYDAYDLAEAINLFSILDQHDQVEKLVNFFVKKMRTKKGMMKFRYYKGFSNIFDGISFNRYANTAMLLAVSKFIYFKEKNNAE